MLSTIDMGFHIPTILIEAQKDLAKSRGLKLNESISLAIFTDLLDEDCEGDLTRRMEEFLLEDETQKSVMFKCVNDPDDKFYMLRTELAKKCWLSKSSQNDLDEHLSVCQGCKHYSMYWAKLEEVQGRF